ncbi:chromate transporter [Lysobacter soli]|uniref:chromate transporter n=1 Tax=Lysobacter soli TaxID=453783 RepID=UPI0020A0F5BB|nr:chromate transporter [Lysobacter soli]UTA56029.1 chromate transporter [Lysobacter soli]
MYGRGVATALLIVFACGLVTALAWPSHGPTLGAMTAAFYRAGALVFGGGHVVLPLLQEALVDPGWIAPDRFLAGYGAAQAVPGPMFSIAAYLGAIAPTGWPPALSALVALLAIFLPGFLLLAATLPVWQHVQAMRGAAPMLAGVNAAVVGLLAAAFHDPGVGTRHRIVARCRRRDRRLRAAGSTARGRVVGGGVVRGGFGRDVSDGLVGDCPHQPFSERGRGAL